MGRGNILTRAEEFKKGYSHSLQQLYRQHNISDTLWYAKTRTWDNWSPKVKRFEVGDLVYLRRRKVDTLDVNVGRIILTDNRSSYPVAHS